MSYKLRLIDLFQTISVSAKLGALGIKSNQYLRVFCALNGPSPLFEHFLNLEVTKTLAA